MESADLGQGDEMILHQKAEFQARFGEALAVARHKDQKASWPWYGRLFHWAFVRCSICKLGRKKWR